MLSQRRRRRHLAHISHLYLSVSSTANQKSISWPSKGCLRWRLARWISHLIEWCGSFDDPGMKYKQERVNTIVEPNHFNQSIRVPWPIIIDVNLLIRTLVSQNNSRFSVTKLSESHRIWRWESALRDKSNLATDVYTFCSAVGSLDLVRGRGISQSWLERLERRWTMELNCVTSECRLPPNEWESYSPLSDLWEYFCQCECPVRQQIED